MAFSSSMLRNTILGLESSDIAVAPLLQGIVDVSTLGRDYWVPDEQFFEVLVRATQASRQPGLGLNIGRWGAHWEAFGAVGLYISLVKSFNEAVRAMVRFNRATRDRQDVFVLQDQQTIAVQFGPFDAPLSARQFLAEAGLAATGELLRRFAGRHATPVAALLDYPEPPHAAMYSKVLACSVHFGQPRAALVVARVVAEKERVFFQPELAAQLGRLAESQLAGAETPHSMRQTDAALCIAERVRACMQRGRRSYAISMTVIARELGVSERSLRRHLAREGLDFRSLVAQSRLEVACEMLRNGMVVKQVADELGYRSPSAFHRAFRRWAGASPGAFAVEERATSMQASARRLRTRT